MSEIPRALRLAGSPERVSTPVEQQVTTAKPVDSQRRQSYQRLLAKLILHDITEENVPEISMKTKKERRADQP